MDTIHYNDIEKELTIHKTPSKKNSYNFAGTKLKIDEIQNVLFYRARRRILLYTSFLLFLSQIVLSTLEIGLHFNTPFFIGMMISASMFILFILYFALPNFAVAVFKADDLNECVMDISKSQMLEANMLSSGLNKFRQSSTLGLIVQSKKLTIAEKGSALFISGKCAIRTGTLYDSTTLTAEILPSKNTIITNKIHFNPLPIISLAAGIILLISTAVIGSCVSNGFFADLIDPNSLEEVLGLALLGTALIFVFVAMYVFFSLLLIILGLCFLPRVRTSTLKIKLSDNFILRCRLRAKDHANINYILHNIANFVSPTMPAAKEYTYED